MIHKRVKAARKAKKLTQKELAEKIGVSPNTINMWESGLQGIRLTQLTKLALALDVSVCYLVEGDKASYQEILRLVRQMSKIEQQNLLDFLTSQ